MGAGAALTARGSDALKSELEKACSRDRIRRIRRDVAEAELEVERLRPLHSGQGVEADLPVADPPCLAAPCSCAIKSAPRGGA